MNVLASRAGILASILTGLGISTAVVAEPTKKVTVDCTRGETIAKALAQGNESQPLLVMVRGTCNESVLIDRDDVALRGEAGLGGAINGPDSTVDTLTVSANRVTIEDLSIGGGRNGIMGISAGGLNVRNTTVQSTGRTGIIYASGSSGVVEGCTVRLNPRDGVTVDRATAIIINSDVSQNLRGGIFVGTGGSARIGIDLHNLGAGNSINQNGATGVTIVDGGNALMGMNQINGNGTDPTSTAGRFGIFVGRANADIVGGNTISGNAGQGIFAGSSNLVIGNTAVGLSSVNTITGNGSAASPGGVFAFLGSAVVIRDAVVSGNNGPGLAFSLRSHGQIFSSTIQDNLNIGTCPPMPGGFCNPGDGIRLIFGSALLPSTPTTVVSGNAGFGISCTDGESSVLNTGLPALSISGNALGDVAGSCTGF
jgi:parallel beta-helix repeat protein